MTLRELIRNNPAYFYLQTWYADEAFMDEPAPEDAPTTMPESVSNNGIDPGVIMWVMEDPQPAVVLAKLYIDHPRDPVWKRYLWTSDLDHLGQRVYVGDNGKGLEIHRHLHLTERWGVPSWEK